MIGTTLRIRYEVLAELDDSPLFVAYRARDRVTGKDVCIRVLQEPFSHELPFLTKLAEVAGTLSAVHHANLERVCELDDHEGLPFLVCEGSPGMLLDEKAKRLAPFSALVCVSLAMEVCAALDALHGSGIVHGDLSARNIMISTEGKVRLMLGGVWSSYAASRTAGAVVLPAMAPYLAPEITAGGMPSISSDVYATGILLFELLTGRHPYSADTPISMALKHATAPVPSLRTINAAVPVVLDEIVRKALAKSPHDRYPDARTLLSDLRTLHDAMRFGKSLTWPIRSSSAPASAAGVQPIAPKMGAVRQEIKETRARVRQEPELSDGIPKWLLVMGYIAACAAVIMVGGLIAWNFTNQRWWMFPTLRALA